MEVERVRYSWCLVWPIDRTTALLLSALVSASTQLSPLTFQPRSGCLQRKWTAGFTKPCGSEAAPLSRACVWRKSCTRTHTHGHCPRSVRDGFMACNANSFPHQSLKCSSTQAQFICPYVRVCVHVDTELMFGVILRSTCLVIVVLRTYSLSMRTWEQYG